MGHLWGRYSQIYIHEIILIIKDYEHQFLQNKTGISAPHRKAQPK